MPFDALLGAAGGCWGAVDALPAAVTAAVPVATEPADRFSTGAAVPGAGAVPTGSGDAEGLDVQVLAAPQEVQLHHEQESGHDCARVDMRLDDEDRIYILEVNSLPSLGMHGSYVEGAAAVGLDFPALINRLVGEQRLLVDDRTGTPRDPIDTLVERGERRFLFVDTAGIRRKGRTDRGPEVL